MTTSMNKALKIPPRSKSHLTPPNALANKLSSLIGTTFPLTRRTRTDGANARKLIAKMLETSGLPPAVADDAYTIVPPKKKGVPKILREYIDTYLVTSGESYNLQVWNRNPASVSVQVEYASGDTLSAQDVRFVFMPVDTTTHIIRSIVVLTPDYIESHFGRFGKPTIKHQLIISAKARQKILSQATPLLFYDDTDQVSSIATSLRQVPQRTMHDAPESGDLLSIKVMKDILVQELLGSVVAPGATKNRGQALELRIAQMLGYTPSKADLLAGGYPDIRNQLLEVKVQDSPTVDLGAYSPQFEEPVSFSNDVMTTDIRYLIALMNPKSSQVEGIVLCPGKHLGEHFSYVADKSFKCQRSIPMEFFRIYDGEAVFNP